LLGFTLILVNQLLLVVDLLSTFLSGVGHALVLEVGHGALALGDHLTDRFAFHSLVVRILHIKLLLARKILLQLLLNTGGALHLGDVHVVASILHLLTALLLSLEGLVAAFTLLLLSHLSLHLLSHEPFIVTLSQVNELVSFLRCFLDFLLRLLVLHLEHAHAITEKFYVILDLVFHAFYFVDCAWHL